MKVGSRLFIKDKKQIIIHILTNLLKDSKIYKVQNALLGVI